MKILCIWWYHKQLCIIMPIWQRCIKNIWNILKISTMKMSGGHFTDIWPRDKISAFHILTFHNILLFHNSDNENLKMVIMIIIKAMMVMIIGLGHTTGATGNFPLAASCNLAHCISRQEKSICATRKFWFLPRTDWFVPSLAAAGKIVILCREAWVTRTHYCTFWAKNKTKK